MNFYGGSVEGIVNFDTRCATLTFYTSLYIVYNAKLAFLNRSLCSLHDLWNFLQRENFRCTGHATTSIDRGKTCRQAAVHAPSCFRAKRNLSYLLLRVTVLIMAEVDSRVNVRFEGDLQQALEESLSSFPMWCSWKRSQGLLLRRLWGEEMFSSNCLRDTERI